MKNIFIILSLVFSFTAHAADFKSNEEIFKKLSAYKTEDIEGDAKRLEKKEKLKIDEMFDDLEAASKYVVKNSLTPEVALEMERVCLITFLHDPATFGADLILPAYDKHRDVFKAAAKKLHPYDMGILLEVLSSKSDVLKNGQ
ncbi:MAG: hypothetical protein EOO38_05280 [Cytophagaceae bacterium]|nr:MAG: hypothetical protein EOO38_05280 [Cytophagaceae bacterium]